MNQERNEMLLDLLTTKATYGLSETEQAELNGFDQSEIDSDFESLEIAAAAIGLVGLDTREPMPAHLQSKILADADSYFNTPAPATETVLEPETEPPAFQEAVPVYSVKPERSFFGWFGWAVAAAACLALVINVGLTRFQSDRVAKNPTPSVTPTPERTTPLQEYAQMMGASTGMIKANWSAGNVKEMPNVAGDIVWSDEKQVGYMRVDGLPVNDPSKGTYQLWIFDKTQDPAKPIDGGTFDVGVNGEIIIKIKGNLKAESPHMFAITMEKPGGVMVSDRKKIAALAMVPKTET